MNQTLRHHIEPTEFAFDAESEAKIATILARYPAGKQASATIPLLYLVQRQMGRPIGRFHLQLCGTTPCMLRGSDDVMRACHDAAHVHVGQTSADGLFTLTEVECLGACVNAPVLQVDDDYYEDLDYDRTVALIEALKRGERPKPGSTIGRQTSAPEGGPLTLTEVPAR